MLSKIKLAVRQNDTKFIKLILRNQSLAKSLSENVLYDDEHGKISLIEFAKENGTDEMSEIIAAELSK